MRFGISVTIRRIQGHFGKIAHHKGKKTQTEAKSAQKKTSMHRRRDTEDPKDDLRNRQSTAEQEKLQAVFTKEVHRTVIIVEQKRGAHRIKHTAQITLKAIFGFAELTLIVMHLDLGNLKASAVRQNGNITVIFAVYVEGFYHFFSISLEAAVKVMKLNT